MARVTPQEFAEKWSRRTKGATGDYAKGVRRVTEAPGEKAAQQADRMVAGVQQAVSEGKWQDRVRAVSLSEWQAAAVEKGQGRIAQGVDSAQADMQKFGGELLSHVDSGLSALDATPRGDLETNLSRMNTWARHMAGFRRSP